MNERPPRDGEPLLKRTQRVADDLVEALAAAQHDSGGWRDASQTDDLVHTALQVALERLAASNCWGEENRPASNALWKIAGSWLEAGWLQRRAREKPRGYAGDFELLAKIDRHWICDDPLGRSFDRFFQAQSAPQAVRNRHQWLRRALVDLVRQRGPQAVRFACVGSGPACEVSGALNDLTASERQQARITLLDLDPAALEFAQRELAHLVPTGNLLAVRENLFRLARVAGKAAVLGRADLISCPGLFDYLSDQDASALLATFWHHLAPGGRLMVFNFAPQHPSQAYMEWIGNWYLVYRSRVDLRTLAEASGIPSACVTISSECTATDLALIADKPRDA